MGWLSRCGDTVAGRRYQRRLLSVMAVYVVLVLACTWLAKHAVVAPPWVYVVAVLPAVPIVMTLVVMGQYLREERDEYVRMQVVLGLLAGAALLLSVMVVNDFLRVMTHMGPLPPFTGYMLFFAGMAVTQGVLKLRDRTTRDD